MRIEFMPHLTSMLHMKDGAEVNGKFAIFVNDTEGVISGTYQVTRTAQDVCLSMQMENVYQPVSGDKWVRAYRWESVVHLDDDGPTMDAQWHKKQTINDGLKVTVVD